MSLPVALAALAEQIEVFGDVAFLITVGESVLPHTVSVTVGWHGDDLSAGAGGQTSANIAKHSGVTLLWPARAGEAYGLIVDGVAQLRPDQSLSIRPTGAVLHRMAGADPSLDSCVRLLPG